MKQIDGKSKRVQKYDRMFFWYPPAGGVGMLLLTAWASDWDWGTVIGGLFAGALIFAPLAILLRDVP